MLVLFFPLATLCNTQALFLTPNKEKPKYPLRISEKQHNFCCKLISDTNTRGGKKQEKRSLGLKGFTNKHIHLASGPLLSLKTQGGL